MTGVAFGWIGSHDFRHESVDTSHFSHASRGPEGIVRPGGCLYQSRVGPLNWTFETVRLANARARPRQEAAQGCKRSRREGFGVHRHRRLESDRQIGGTSLFGHRWPRARCSSDFKKGAASNLPMAAKSLGTGMQARIMLVGLGDCLKGSSAALGSLNVRAPDHTARGLRC
jgi:hypothetical protein